MTPGVEGGGAGVTPGVEPGGVVLDGRRALIPAGNVASIFAMLLGFIVWGLRQEGRQDRADAVEVEREKSRAAQAAATSSAIADLRRSIEDLRVEIARDRLETVRNKDLSRFLEDFGDRNPTVLLPRTPWD